MKTVYVRTKTKDEARKRAEWLYMILRDCTPVIADLHTSKAQVVTETMVIKYVPKNYTMDGIRCDIAIGFGQLGKIIACSFCAFCSRRRLPRPARAAGRR